MTTSKKTKSEKEKKPRTKKINVLFVCTGNTCRSAMACYIFRYFLQKKRKLSLYTVSSAGIAAENGAPMSENAQAALALLGVPVKKPHKAQQLTVAAARKADLIVCMTERHKQALGSFASKALSVAALTGGGDVPDPYGGDLQTYLKTANYLTYAAEDVYAAASKTAAAQNG